MGEPIQSDDTHDSCQLFSAARAGDDSALWRLTERFRPYLKALVRRELGPELGAKIDDSDVVQQSMIRAANRFSDFDGNNLNGWQAWLVAITRNEARNAVRFWHTQRRDAFREQTNGYHDPPEDLTPSGVAMQREHAAKLLALVSQLPEGQRQYIVLRFFDNLSHREIADQLNISVANSRQRVKKALLKLHTLWERQR